MRSEQIRNKSSWGERHKVVAICFVMTALTYSMRFNLSFAIVAMVSDDTNTTMAATKSRVSNSTTSSQRQTEMCPSLQKPTSMTSSNLTTRLDDLHETETLLRSHSEQSKKKNPTFNWDEKDQGLILGSFFWGYMLSQFPSGILVQKYGGKWIIAFSTLATGILSIVLPSVAIFGGRNYIIVIRILQGITEGFMLPAMTNLKAKWFPPEERARLSSICFTGLPFGTAVTLLMSGQVIPVFGWPAVFYIPGVLSVIFFLFWIMTIHDSPDAHPSISADELHHITNSIGSLSKCENVIGDNRDPEISKMGPAKNTEFNLRSVPWMEISCSLPVWIAFVSQFCSCWGHNMLKSEGPKYLHSALHFDIHENSYIAASPFLVQMLFSPLIARLSDLLLERKLISMLTARKLCNTIGQWGVALGFVGIIASGCNRLPAVTFYILIGMVSGASGGGSYINIIDLSPKYAAVIEGAINTVANVAGFGAPYLAGLILYYEPSILGWCYVFAFPAILNFIGNLVYLIGADVKVQRWNY